MFAFQSQMTKSIESRNWPAVSEASALPELGCSPKVIRKINSRGARALSCK